jgi:integrase/recombinase XerD
VDPFDIEIEGSTFFSFSSTLELRMRNASNTLADAIPLFLSTKKVDSGLAKNSTESYERDLIQFLNHLESEEQLMTSRTRRLDEITVEDLERFLTAKKHEGLKSTSVARKTSTLRQFFKFCQIELDLENNPAEGLRANVIPRSLPKVLSIEKIEALIAATEEGLDYTLQKNADALRARDRAMLLLLYATGLRVTELISIRAGNIDFDLNFVKVMGKGSKERLVPYVQEAREKLIDYRDHHRQKLFPVEKRGLENKDTPFFLTEAGSAMSRQAFWKLLKNLGKKAGIDEDISPHWIRHSFATHLLEGGLNLRTLQTLLGHADVSTTQIYTEMSPGHLKEVHAKFHPRGEKD